MKKIFISDINGNGPLSTYFLVAQKERKLKKNGEPYWRLSLADRTGSIDANMWDNINEATSVLETSPIVAVIADIGEYKGQPQLTVRQITALSDDEYDIADLIKALPDRDKVFAAVVAYIREVKEPFLRTLIDTFLNDTDLMDKFKRCPGGMLWHHAYIGGLLQHTFEVMRLGIEMCAINPEVDRDLVIVGGFLHDMGKIYELDYELSFNYTDQGRLLGHIAIGYEILERQANKIPGFPDDLLMELKHIVLSHQGEYEQRSPTLPQTIEACIVYHCDNLSSQTNAFKSVVFGPRMEGESWSKWYPIISRQMLLREQKENVF
ncbi:MAG: HD domain-containing protein [Candidatus Omnitrophica bacterium]|nr:HD domain-containing protein [Candidatus Omnitrophota bacterium]